MPLSQILAISCFLTGIVMAVLIVGLLVAMRFGQQGIQSIIERFTNPEKNKGGDNNRRREREEVSRTQPQQPQIASSQSLRQRAQNLDFPAPAGGFSSQAAPQGNFQQAQPARASLRARDQYPDFNPQQQQTSQSFQPNMPSLSASRPFQGTTQPSQPQYPQQQGFQQQGFQQPQQPQQGGYPQQQGNFQPLRPQQAPQPPQYPQQQGFQQQGLTQPSQSQYPQQQGNFQPLRPQQAPQAPQPPQYPQQQGFQQQGFQQPQQPQQGGLGEYRPGLSNTPRPDLRTQSQRPVRRDTRRNDEQDDGGILGAAGNLIDGAEDILDF